jgi:hypothetical protein
MDGRENVGVGRELSNFCFLIFFKNIFILKKSQINIFI